jgi:aminopeptidase N
LDYHFGTKAGNQYIIGTRKAIKNDKPIIGTYNVNREGSLDMYYKGANMIHTLRQVIDDDEIFRRILLGLNKEFYHQTVNTEQIEEYITNESGIDLSAFFNQYLRTIKIPVLEYQGFKSKIKYRYRNIVNGFSIPVKVLVNDKQRWISPTSKWNELEVGSSDVTFEIDPNFYIIISEIK